MLQASLTSPLAAKKRVAIRAVQRTKSKDKDIKFLMLVVQRHRRARQVERPTARPEGRVLAVLQMMGARGR